MLYKLYGDAQHELIKWKQQSNMKEEASKMDKKWNLKGLSIQNPFYSYEKVWLSRVNCSRNILVTLTVRSVWSFPPRLTPSTAAAEVLLLSIGSP